MKVESVIRLVNTMCKDHKYAKARPLIVSEWKRLTESKNYHLLNSSAQQFIKIIKEEQENGTIVHLSYTDKQVLNVINSYVKDSHFQYARKIFSEHLSLLEKQEAQGWLTSDARYIFNAWKNSTSSDPS